MRLASRWVNAACVATGIFAVTSGAALADVKIGVTLSATGPAASTPLHYPILARDGLPKPLRPGATWLSSIS